ncbi:MAG TPA: septation regulator SpoVG [bacterium]|nr:septation regulator SpoVG [bacterium]
MEITEVRISLHDEDKLKAFVTITFDDCFVVRGVKVIYGNNGLFVAMPSRRKPDGTFQDIAHPINRDMREKVEERILQEYSAEVERAGTSDQAPSTHSWGVVKR